MAHRFKCSTCDKWHEGFPDVGYSEPRYAADIPAAERATRVFLTSDFCIVDKEHYFIRCILPLHVNGTEDEFCWGVWSTLSETNFQRYQTQFDDDLAGWEPMFGYLANSLPGYPDTLSLKLNVQTRGRGDRPVVMLQPTDHPLALDQRDGIALEKVLEIVSPFLEH